MFQHTAARRRLPKGVYLWKTKLLVSTHSRPKAAAGDIYRSMKAKDVSTHSRPKAAACVQSLMRLPAPCFNTQPPEGGCIRLWWCAGWQYICFNTQPPEGGCLAQIIEQLEMAKVSTHSRPKAAAFFISPSEKKRSVSTHSRPKAAA